MHATSIRRQIALLVPTSTQARNRTNRSQKEVMHDTPETKTKHTTGGIPRWSPTLVLVARFSAYVWQSGRDAQFSLTYGRMWYSDQLRRNLSLTWL